MTSDLARGESIPWLVRRLLSERGEISSGDVAEAAGVTRQAAHYHLRRMVESGELAPTGRGRGSRYALRAVWVEQLETSGLEEHLVWRRLTEEVGGVEAFNENSVDIARFAFTELLNNAIDHSKSEVVSVSVVAGAIPAFVIVDEGIGVFENVRRNKDLEDHLAALQLIATGKATTDPSHHTGQGIFFTSKAVDVFSLASNGLEWVVDNRRDDHAIARVKPHRGTRARFGIDPATTRSIGDVFDAYTDPETYEFDTTRTVVRLFGYGVTFVSRSEAKRLTRNLDKFREVIVDFNGVDRIGQGFADEIFRVWQSEHPEVTLVPINMASSVTALVEQARRAYQDAKGMSPR